MRRGEPERDSQTLRLRVRRYYCWDEKTEKGEKNPHLCRVCWHARTGQDRERHPDKTHGLLWAWVAV